MKNKKEDDYKLPLFKKFYETKKCKKIKFISVQTAIVYDENDLNDLSCSECFCDNVRILKLKNLYKYTKIAKGRNFLFCLNCDRVTYRKVY